MKWISAGLLMCTLIWLFGMVWFSPLDDVQTSEQAHEANPQAMMTVKSIPNNKTGAHDRPFDDTADDTTAHINQHLVGSLKVALPSVPKQRPIEQVDKTVTPSTQQTREVLTTLNELDAKAIQFYFPQNDRKRNEIVQHMYRCEGLVFGAVDKETQSQLTILSNQQDGQAPRSELLRVVNQNLSKHERQLLSLYAAHDTPVRVFPYALDFTLASLIANELINHHGAAELQQFGATYVLVNKQLRLRNIKVNGRVLDTSWLLSAKPCLS
ncbi:hypothetical protein [Brumicola blandensis]|uniref:Uncharacterized protein n=1 Tax=Brumicola blandensis TaxID=3075611 RepID=A0AAW8QVK2_9ALTE|nr:hypothetical protein [Alteromonas sp. W409]MDT0581208.1 hypothetical protein [Alteromonas sp. W409]